MKSHHNRQLAATKAKFRRDGFYPAPRLGKGEWVHKDDARVRTLRYDDVLGWSWRASVSPARMIQQARAAVAARR